VIVQSLALDGSANGSEGILQVLPRRRVLTVLALVLSASVGLSIMLGQNYASGQSYAVIPLLDCVVYEPQTSTLVAFFGYVSTFPDPVTIDLESNHFNPPPVNRGQPVEFQPGLHPRVFSTHFHTQQYPELRWHFQERTVSASNDPSRYCEDGAEPGLVWQGSWDESTKYSVGDAVSYQGSSFIATAANQDEAPDGSDVWHLLAQKGEPGTVGSPGPPGSDGVSGHQTVVSQSFSVPARSTITEMVSCPGAKLPLSGGFQVVSTLGTTTQAPELLGSYPDGQEWLVTLRNPNPRTTVAFQVHAVCASIS
jgi:hypothetical protein